jgi:HK97 family phage prohead protease
MKRGYSLLEIKSVDEDLRQITGIASTPEVDHMGDIVLPQGAKYVLPIPLLLGHDHAKPIGSVTAVKVSARGIEIRATIARTSTPGLVRDRLEAAWADIRLGLIRGLSVGFSVLKSEPLKGGGRKFLEWVLHEISCVVVPANAGAGIETIKSADRQSLRSTKHRGAIFLSDPPGTSRFREEHRGSVYLKSRRKFRSDPNHRGAAYLDLDRSPGSFRRD